MDAAVQLQEHSSPEIDRLRAALLSARADERRRCIEVCSAVAKKAHPGGKEALLCAARIAALPPS